MALETLGHRPEDLDAELRWRRRGLSHRIKKFPAQLSQWRYERVAIACRLG